MHQAAAIHWRCHDIFHGIPQGGIEGGIAVVIDVLRASTTIVTALSNGARDVVPVATVADARRLAAAGGVVTGGERGGVKIDGFDLGNSPLEYSADRIAGRRIVITTTNGTAALAACEAAAVVLIGAVVNRSAVGAMARSEAVKRGAAVHLVCAGTDGEVTEEDLLGAGAILDAAATDDDHLDATAHAALARYIETVGGRTGTARGEAIAAALAESRGGHNLSLLGMRADIAVAAAVDSLAIVPTLEPAGRRLVAAGHGPA